MKAIPQNLSTFYQKKPSMNYKIVVTFNHKKIYGYEKNDCSPRTGQRRGGYSVRQSSKPQQY
jgi:hypothetical protein